MRITTGRVVNGRIEIAPGEQLPEGAIATVLFREQAGSFELGPEAEAALLASLEEADRGELIPAEDLLSELRPA